MPLTAQAGSDGSLRWRTLRSEHFFMHYYQGEEPLAREFLAIGEEAYAYLAGEFGFEPSETGHLVLVDDMDSANGLTLVVPYNVIVLFAYVPDSAGELGFWGDWKRILMYHELVHTFHLERVRGFLRAINWVLGKTFLPNSAMPTWFIEGLAVSFESSLGIGGRVGSPLYESYMRLAVHENAFLTMDEMTGSPLKLPRGSIPYLYGSYFMSWLRERAGGDNESFARFVSEQARKFNPFSLNISARRIFGKTFVELYGEWKAELSARMQLTVDVVEAQGVVEGERLTFAGEVLPMPSYTPDGTILWLSATGRDTRQLREYLPGGKTRRITWCRGDCDRPQQTAGGEIFYSTFNYLKTYYYYQDLMRHDRKEERTERLTQGLRVKDPSPSPDANEVAFVRTALGHSSLVVRSLEDGVERVLLESDGGLAWPAWSPDGRLLAVSSHVDGLVDLLLVDKSSLEVRNLTPGVSMEVQPVFAPDGRKILFSSSRSGIFNIYSHDFESGCTVQLTNVIGGAYSPTVHPNGSKVAFASFHHDGYYLHELPLGGGECIAEAFSGEPGHRPPGGRPELDLSAQSGLESSRYNPFRHVYPRSWMPSFLADSWNSTVFGADVYGSDPVGLLYINLGGRYNTENHDSTTALSFSIDAWYPSISFYLGYYRDTLWARPDDDWTDYRERDVYSSVAVRFPFYQTNYLLSLSMGYAFEHFTGEIVDQWEFDPGSTQPYFPVQGNLGTAYTGLSYDSTESYAYSTTTEKGVRASTELRLSSPFLGSNWTEYHVKWRLTRYTPMPWLNHHVLMTHLRGGWAGGRDQFMRKFSVGGYPDQDVVSDMLYGTVMGGTYLRGYPPLAKRGRQYHFATADYYFPIWRIRRGIQTFPIFLKDIYADVFGNGGAAFNDFDFGQFLWGAGAELRLKFVVGYHLPFTLIVGSAYGFQEPGGFSTYFMVGQ